jgi:hypothetical protein
LKAIKYAQPFSLFVFYIAHFALATVNFLWLWGQHFYLVHC